MGYIIRTMHNSSLSKQHPSKTKFVVLLLMTVFTCFIAGVSLPFMTISQFLFFDNTVSILSGVLDLWRKQEYGLFLIIFLFTIITPIIKIGLLSFIWFSPFGQQDKYIRLIEKYGKWSMLDVFVVALMIVIIKLDGVAEVEAHIGAYVFAASVLLTMIFSEWLDKPLDK